ncbi:helix-turn-helix domain-containing protein [Chryseobacterium oryctis]|uniref:AraC family transcriptional regulator n=1 Tax=Chryseobacterium oryctis TaxID=2952618 RepID=A0ABT3HRQ8_9FLAO|nr:AraC family transcriptional regulator [Chryseobacterium oryctis]MCW3162476.1 AraC family transcriptional regulator [Chryseobacterium oryctis]
MKKDKNIPQKRSAEIVKQYFEFLDHHINDVISGEVQEFMELNQIAASLAISHNHLADTIQKETGNHPCHFYDLKIIEEAKKMLTETDKSIADIAKILTYDPSNFSKFFKKFVGATPGQFRKISKK